MMQYCVHPVSVSPSVPVASKAAVGNIGCDFAANPPQYASISDGILRGIFTMPEPLLMGKLMSEIQLKICPLDFKFELH